MNSIPQVKERPNRKIDPLIAFKLRSQGKTLQEIANICHTTPPAVDSSLRRNWGAVAANDFREFETDLLAAKRGQLLAMLSLSKMQKMGGYQLAVAYGILLDKERDIRGLTAQNHSTFINLIMLADSKDMGKITEVKNIIGRVPDSQDCKLLK